VFYTPDERDILISQPVGRPHFLVESITPKHLEVIEFSTVVDGIERKYNAQEP